MNPHTNYVAVGLFLLVGIVAGVILVMWLGKAGDSEPKARYVVAIEGDVNGLSNGSVVSFLGVNVGSVTDIRLHTGTVPLVEVVIAIREDLPINDTTYATLVVQGVTGIANVDLANDPSQAAPMATHANGMRVIPFRATGLSAMLAGSGDLTIDARRLLARLNAWAGEENRAQVEGILADLRSVSSALAGQRDDIPEMMASLKNTLRSLEKTAQGLETAVGDDWPVIAADLRATSTSLASASARVDGWLATNEESVDRLLGEGLGDMSELVVDLRGVADQLNRLSSRLREDPSRLIYRAQKDPVVAEP